MYGCSKEHECARFVNRRAGNISTFYEFKLDENGNCKFFKQKKKEESITK